MSRSARFERTLRRAAAVSLLVGMVLSVPASSTAAPEGQLTWGVHISLAPTWFDPAETPGIITPFNRGSGSSAATRSRRPTRT